MDAYEEVRLIGRGSYGTAQLVRKRDTNELVVVKCIALTALTKKERRDADRECKVLAQLNHPNILRYLDSFIQEDVLHIVTEYCEYGDLAKVIKEQKKAKSSFAEDQILNWFVQIVMAVDHIHQKKILHRDLKTGNVFLADKNVIKLGDFGIARVLDSTLDQANTVIGTPYYMSPEVCENKAYDFKSDLWAMGCILYELCTLNHAFEANHLLGLATKIVNDSYPPIPDRYSPDLSKLVSQLLSKNPQNRPKCVKIFGMPFINERLKILASETHVQNIPSEQTGSFQGNSHQGQPQKFNNVMQPFQPTMQQNGVHSSLENLYTQDSNSQSNQFLNMNSIPIQNTSKISHKRRHLHQRSVSVGNMDNTRAWRESNVQSGGPQKLLSQRRSSMIRPNLNQTKAFVSDNTLFSENYEVHEYPGTPKGVSSRKQFPFAQSTTPRNGSDLSVHNAQLGIQSDRLESWDEQAFAQARGRLMTQSPSQMLQPNFNRGRRRASTASSMQNPRRMSTRTEFSPDMDTPGYDEDLTPSTSAAENMWSTNEFNEPLCSIARYQPTPMSRSNSAKDTPSYYRRHASSGDGNIQPAALRTKYQAIEDNRPIRSSGRYAIELLDTNTSMEDSAELTDKEQQQKQLSSLRKHRRTKRLERRSSSSSYSNRSRTVSHDHSLKSPRSITANGHSSLNKSTTKTEDGDYSDDFESDNSDSSDKSSSSQSKPNKTQSTVLSGSLDSRRRAKIREDERHVLNESKLRTDSPKNESKTQSDRTQELESNGESWMDDHSELYGSKLNALRIAPTSTKRFHQRHKSASGISQNRSFFQQRNSSGGSVQELSGYRNRSATVSSSPRHNSDSFVTQNFDQKDYSMHEDRPDWKTIVTCMKQRLIQLFGESDYNRVYDYLKKVHQKNSTSEGTQMQETQDQLIKLVGETQLEKCYEIDQLINIEETYLNR